MNNLKKLILIAVLLCCSIGNYTADAATINAASCSQADVTAAYTAAAAGDTVAIPAGNCTWTAQLSVTKSITIMGAGASSTKITRGALTTPLINIALPLDVPVRISGIYFDQVTNAGKDQTAIFVAGKKNGSFSYTKIRIDNNTFNKGRRPIFWYGWSYGVVDHNQFINCDMAVMIIGDSNYAWQRPIAAGTANAVFIEDNIFTLNNNATEYEPGLQIYHQDGARTVTRYNTFDGTAYTSGNSMFFDSHPNQKYYLGTTADFRGQPLIEIYNNHFHAYKTYYFIYLRGGSSLIFNNTFDYDYGSPPLVIALTEEESWQTLFFNPLRTTWPAEDQITNSFFWNNTLKGAAVTDARTWMLGDGPFIQKDRDYFMHEPQATGGKSTYPTRAGASDMTFSSSGANAYYPYSTYTYPHPLTGVAGTSTTPTTTTVTTPPPEPTPTPTPTPTTTTTTTTTKKRIWNR
jgi:hypothetical protein